MSAVDIKAIVATGYDMVSRAYEEGRDPLTEDYYREWLQPILQGIAPGAPVLDLGCGCGVPASRILATHFVLTGVDISPVQIERARSLIPQACFIVADMTAVSFAPETFDAIVCLYAIIHVPLEQQPALLHSICRWLRPGGMALVTVGGGAWTGTEEDWLGVKGATMFWSHADADTYRRWFGATGFTTLEDTFEPKRLLKGDSGGHQRFLLRKPKGPF